MTEPVLRQGDAGAAVATLQGLLGIAADGRFGPATRAAVVEAQSRAGLVTDGIVGPRTWAALRAHASPKRLRAEDLLGAANLLGVPVASVHAVIAVESRGNGFLSDGRPVILFERHVFYRRLLADGMDAELIALAVPDLCNPQRGGYLGGAAEHERLRRARRIHREAGIESASWGLFQIMGFHWEHLGFDSADHWAAVMAESEGAQLDAFVRFVRADRPLHLALQARDWAAFARRYNGPAYRDNRYDERMAAAFAQFSSQA